MASADGSLVSRVDKGAEDSCSRLSHQGMDREVLNLSEPEILGE